ncbi:MAG: hypothetical protein AAF471_04925 [Myxococcota bacterium]
MGETVGGEVMTLGLALKREGKQEGLRERLRQGRQEGLLEAARKMLSAGVDVGVVSKAMGLPRRKLAALRAK